MTRQLGIITEVIEIVIDVAVWVYNWIDASNQPDKWSSWDDATKEKFVTDALNQAFVQTKLPPRDWFWQAISDAGYTRDDYDTFMSENSDWIPARIAGMEKITGKKFNQINLASATPKKASLFSTNDILGIIGGVLFFGVAAFMVFNAAKQSKANSTTK
jgi:hypothetical protein